MQHQKLLLKKFIPTLSRDFQNMPKTIFCPFTAPNVTYRIATVVIAPDFCWFFHLSISIILYMCSRLHNIHFNSFAGSNHNLFIIHVVRGLGNWERWIAPGPCWGIRDKCTKGMNGCKWMYECIVIFSDTCFICVNISR